MKGKKFRYDEKKLTKSSSLKKKIALHLAKEKYARFGKDAIDVVEALAFGLKQRPYVSMSDKDLIKAFDENYCSKLEHIEELQKELVSDTGNVARWHKDSIKKTIERANEEIRELQPIIDELCEEAFSE